MSFRFNGDLLYPDVFLFSVLHDDDGTCQRNNVLRSRSTDDDSQGP